MRNTETRIRGIGARADGALLLADRTDEARERATEAVRAADLSGRAWWASRDRKPARSRLMVAEGARGAVTAALEAAGVDYEEEEADR